LLCPPDRVQEFKLAGQPLWIALAADAGMSLPAYFERAVPEGCRRIVALHQWTREPDEEAV
jgi:hypothetical protein